MGWLADNNFGDTRSGSLAGPMGLLIILVLAAFTILLIRNMSKRIKRLPPSFDGSGDLPEDHIGDPAAAERAENSSENLP
jgi:hypothetical protein